MKISVIMCHSGDIYWLSDIYIKNLLVVLVYIRNNHHKKCISEIRVNIKIYDCTKKKTMKNES